MNISNLFQTRLFNWHSLNLKSQRLNKILWQKKNPSVFYNMVVVDQWYFRNQVYSQYKQIQNQQIYYFNINIRFIANVNAPFLQLDPP